jgi:predicted transcriptional regulator YdeE
MLECPDYECSGITALWRKLRGFLGRSTGYSEGYGISLPLPGSSRGSCYWAAVRLRPGDTLPAGLSSIAMPAKRYASWPFQDYPSRLPQTFGEIFSQRLLAAGLHPDPHWITLEHYPPDWFDEAAGKLKCDLLVAIS